MALSLKLFSLLVQLGLEVHHLHVCAKPTHTSQSPSARHRPPQPQPTDAAPTSIFLAGFHIVGVT
jgi:hypothetical protein